MKKINKVLATLLCLLVIIGAGSSKIEADGSSVDLEILNKQYAKLFGGASYEILAYAMEDKDGNIIAVGTTYAPGTGDLTGVVGQGNSDALIVKFDSNLNVIKKAVYGGTGEDFLYNVCMDDEGNMVAVGITSSSNSGDLTGLTNNGGATDSLIVKFDTDLTIKKINIFGGSDQDIFEQVVPFKDGYLVVGYSGYSTTGDFASIPRYGLYDGVMIYYDKDLNIKKARAFGGPNGDDYILSVKVDSNNKIYIVGNSGGVYPNGDFDGLYQRGGRDGTVARFDENFNTEKVILFGGDTTDELSDLKILDNGDIIVIGISYSDNTGDLIGVSNNGMIDILMVKLDKDLNVLDKKLYGGAGDDRALGISGNDEFGYLISGATNSSLSGDFINETNNGGMDGVFVRIDKNLGIHSHGLIGGSSDDVFYRSVLTSDNKFVVVGYSASSDDGSLSGVINNGTYDGLIMQLQDTKYLLESTIDKETVLVNTTINDSELIKLFGITATKNGVSEMAKVVVTHSVDSTKPGTYNVTFTYQTGEGNLKLDTVLVVEASKPTIILNKPNVKINLDGIVVNATYVEMFQATASDAIDGDLTSKIVVDDSKVDKTKVGQYQVIFSVANSNNKSATTLGILEVVANDSTGSENPKKPDDPNDDVNKGNNDRNDDSGNEDDNKDVPDTGDNALTIALTTIIIMSGLIITMEKFIKNKCYQ